MKVGDSREDMQKQFHFLAIQSLAGLRQVALRFQTEDEATEDEQEEAREIETKLIW